MEWASPSTESTQNETHLTRNETPRQLSHRQIMKILIFYFGEFKNKIETAQSLIIYPRYFYLSKKPEQKNLVQVSP